MKYVDEYRDATLVKQYAEAIDRITKSPWTIMEICGGQTHAIVKYGLDTLIPASIRLIHGPGCPVCVTPAETIDMAIDLALQPQVILCSFGDMLRVPGTLAGEDLLSVKARGGDVRILYSPLDALKIARSNRDREVVFFAVGFETTAPATAMTVSQAAYQGLPNFSVLLSHVRVPPAMEAILSAPECQVEGFLAAGHVCTVMGYREYESISTKYQVPIVVTGFEPVDILQGIYHCISQLESGRATVDNQYARSVRHEGNRAAIALLERVFETTDRNWRGIGLIPESGLALKPEFAAFDVRNKGLLPSNNPNTSVNSTECISGQILQGNRKPHECPAFGTRCTPDRPLGAPMVSSEGACAAYYRYRQKTV